MNEEKKARVYGSYKNPEEIAKVIRQLKEEGYTRDQIKVYSSTGQQMTNDEISLSTHEQPTNDISNTVVVSDAERKSEQGEEPSFWNQVKDFFTPNQYDYEEESQNPNYRKEHDILYPHREELAQGNRVVVLDKPNENQTRVNI